MPKIGEISIDVTAKTDNLKRGLKDGERAAKEFADKTKKSGREAEAALNQVGKGLSMAQSALVGFIGGLGSGVAMAGLQALRQGVSSLASAMISGNAEMERYSMQFKVLLGGAEQARQRLAELERFGAETPFELPGVVRASKILQSFGGDLLATGESLRLVGDAASMAGVPIDELAVWVGRFYGSLKQGKPAGEAIQRFRELAIITPEFSKQLEKLVKTNGSAAAAWKLFSDELGRAKGLMEEQSTTWEGMWSNMIDQVQMFARTVGKPFFDAAKDGLKATLDWFNGEGGQKAQAQFVALAESAGATLKEVGPKFMQGASEGLLAFLEWLSSGRAQRAVETIWGALKAILALTVAVKAWKGLSALYVGWINAMAVANGTLAASSLAAAGRLGGMQTALIALTKNPWVITLSLVTAGFGALFKFANDNTDWNRLGKEYNGLSNGLGDGKKIGAGGTSANSFRAPGETARNPFDLRLPAESNPVNIFRGAATNVPGGYGPVSPFGPKSSIVPEGKPQPKAKTDAEIEAERWAAFQRDLKNRLGSDKGGGGKGKGKGAAKTGPVVDAFAWLWEGIAEAFKFARETVEKEWEAFGDFMHDIHMRKLKASGAKESDLFLETIKAGRSAVTDPALQKQMHEALLDLEMHERRIENAKKFADAKKEETVAMRDWARELGAEKSVEQWLKGMEEAKNAIGFGFFKALVNNKLKDVEATNKQTEANKTAMAVLREMRQEMGLMAPTSNVDEMRERLFGEKGDMKALGLFQKIGMLGWAHQKDQWIKNQPEVERIAEQTKRYNDTLRDLALKLSLVGESGEEARLQLELLSQGMSTGQAQAIIAIQRQISELEKLRGIADRAADGLTKALLGSFSQIQNGAGAMFGALVQGFRQTLAEMAQEYLRSMIRDILKNFLFSVFRPSAPSPSNASSGALGGIVTRNTPSLAPAGGAPVVVNMTVNTPDAGGFRRAQGQIAQEMITQAARAQRRNG